MSANNRSILFVFGSQPSESAVLEAAALSGALAVQGIEVTLATTAPRAVPVLRDRLAEPAVVLRPGLSWLGGLGRSRLPGKPLALCAWDLQAAGVAVAVAPAGTPVCALLCDPPLDPAALRRIPSPVASILCHSQAVADRLLTAGLSADRVKVVPPAVDPGPLQAGMARRQPIRQGLGLEPAGTTVFAVPRLIGRDEGHFLAAWATLLVRRGGVQARLLLPEPHRQARRAVRFAASCNDQPAIAVAPAGTPWLDILAGADILVVPGPALYDSVAVACAMAVGLPVVTADVPGDPLLAEPASLPARDRQPLNLARAMFRACEERTLAASLAAAGRERVQRLCDPAALVQALLEAVG